VTAGTGPEVRRVHLDEQGRATLDGAWEFFPGDLVREELPDVAPHALVVPGLWEAQGHLELDGVAWYRLRFDLDDADECWTLRFAAVMDVAEVWLNGTLLGRHEHPFTPFELSATDALRAGRNVLEVRVTDPQVDDPFHRRSAHGKQGWANHVFPSRPSLYMTYGGIWQPVTLRRHGAVVTRDVFVTGDPDDLRVTVEVVNTTDRALACVVGVRLLGRVLERSLELDRGESQVTVFELGKTQGARWQPEDPVLHLVLVDVQADGSLSDRRRLRFGLRTVRLEGGRMLLNGAPYRMKSALVQGFRADGLYAEGTREDIVAEVLAARAMGFTMLRLHIKAFDPVYLDVCDELGMLVHCDLPIAEPIAHDELGDGTELSRRCVEAAQEQVRRDRNHPCVVLWSAMNELGLDREDVRGSDAYEQFARTVYDAVVHLDPTRPVIENDWVEPDPDRVFRSPVLTAHWYGRLHSDYLDQLDRQCAQWRDVGRPLYVTEFGDWGLPDMPLLLDAPFWDTRDVYAAGLATTLWPASIARFVRETQRYQGLSDRLQIEVFRRHDHIGGYCLTELTDVPHELNGLLDLHRRPKPLAAAEVRRANQPVLPMLVLSSLVAQAGDDLRAEVHVANDGPVLRDVDLRIRFGGVGDVQTRRLLELDTSALSAEGVAGRFLESTARLRVPLLPAHAPTALGTVSLGVPEVAGNHDLIVELWREDACLAENRYPVHVVAAATAAYDVAVVGGDAVRAALAAVGCTVVDDAHVLVVGEGEMPADRRVREHLDRGGAVVALAQEDPEHFPVPVRLQAVETAWGSSVFHFTTDSPALPSFPRRNVLVAEESTVQARSVLVEVDGAPFPSEPVVIAFKPVPGALTGTVVGEHPVGAGRLLLCQYRLQERAASGDVAARGLLVDLVNRAACSRPPTLAEPTVRDDGRTLTYYSFEVA
jgi:hypothetical protein